MPTRSKYTIIFILGIGVLASIACIARIPYFSYYTKDDDILCKAATVAFRAHPPSFKATNLPEQMVSALLSCGAPSRAVLESSQAPFLRSAKCSVITSPRRTTRTSVRATLVLGHSTLSEAPPLAPLVRSSSWSLSAPTARTRLSCPRAIADGNLWTMRAQSTASPGTPRSRSKSRTVVSTPGVQLKDVTVGTTPTGYRHIAGIGGT